MTVEYISAKVIPVTLQELSKQSRNCVKALHLCDNTLLTFPSTCIDGEILNIHENKPNDNKNQITGR